MIPDGAREKDAIGNMEILRQHSSGVVEANAPNFNRLGIWSNCALAFRHVRHKGHAKPLRVPRLACLKRGDDMSNVERIIHAITRVLFTFARSLNNSELG